MSAPALDDDGLCVCCGLAPAYCGKAAEGRVRAEQQAEAKRLAALPGATLAQHPGLCGDCGETFDRGEPIQARALYPDRHRTPIERGSVRAWRGLFCCGPKP